MAALCRCLEQRGWIPIDLDGSFYLEELKVEVLRLPGKCIEEA